MLRGLMLRLGFVLVACGKPPSKSEVPVGVPTADSARESRGFELVDPGAPPRVELRYALPADRWFEFIVVQQLRILTDGVTNGRVTLSGRLLVTPLGFEAGTTLAVELGPLTLARAGDTREIAMGHADDPNSSAPAWLKAEVVLNRTGQIAARRVLEQRRPDLVMPVFETILNLDRPPAAAVGLGARWRTLTDGAVQESTQAEHELIRLAPGRAVFRVFRLQTRGKQRSSSAFGEWTFVRDRWPVTGADRSTFSLPNANRSRLSASFSVTAAED